MNVVSSNKWDDLNIRTDLLRGIYTGTYVRFIVGLWTHEPERDLCFVCAATSIL
jgi:hypothetical protein